MKNDAINLINHEITSTSPSFGPAKTAGTITAMLICKSYVVCVWAVGGGVYEAKRIPRLCYSCIVISH